MHVWSETTAKRGSVEVVSCLKNFLMTMEVEQGNFLFNIITNNLSGLFMSWILLRGSLSKGFV